MFQQHFVSNIQFNVCKIFEIHSFNFPPTLKSVGCSFPFVGINRCSFPFVGINDKQGNFLLCSDISV